jgi:hypothetical protein
MRWTPEVTLARTAPSPERSNSVQACERPIVRDEREPLDHRGRGNDPIERVPVDPLEPPTQQRMLRADRNSLDLGAAQVAFVAPDDGIRLCSAA